MEFIEVPGTEGLKYPQTVVALNPITGLPFDSANPLFVSLGSENINITGSVNIGDSIEINNSAAKPIPVIGPLTELQLHASPISVVGGLTNTELRDTALEISGTVTVLGALTEAQLRSSPVIVSGGLTDTQLRALPVVVSGPLTDLELRSTALSVSLASVPSHGVTGTFWQATQPVSLATQPLPTGASTAAKQPALGTAGAASSDVLTVQGVASMVALKVDGSGVTQPVSGTVSVSGTVPVSLVSVPTHGVTGTFWQATQPVSASALPLPSGAATSAKQPAIGVSGTPSADVITVQGSATMTPFKVDGSAVTQPVSVNNFSACMDSTGVGFNPGSCTHAFAYTNGLLVTDTATNGASTWIKTYTYSNYDLTGESKWMKQ